MSAIFLPYVGELVSVEAPYLKDRRQMQQLGAFLEACSTGGARVVLVITEAAEAAGLGGGRGGRGGRRLSPWQEARLCGLAHHREDRLEVRLQMLAKGGAHRGVILFSTGWRALSDRRLDLFASPGSGPLPQEMWPYRGSVFLFERWPSAAEQVKAALAEACRVSEVPRHLRRSAEGQLEQGRTEGIVLSAAPAFAEPTAAGLEEAGNSPPGSQAAPQGRFFPFCIPFLVDRPSFSFWAHLLSFKKW